MMDKRTFDKEIGLLVKSGICLENTTLKCTIWHDCDDTLFIATELIESNEYNVIIKGIAYNLGDYLKDNKENLNLLKIEQKQIFNKVKRWVKKYNIKAIADEQNV